MIGTADQLFISIVIKVCHSPGGNRSRYKEWQSTAAPRSKCQRRSEQAAIRNSEEAYLVAAAACQQRPEG